MTEKESRGAFEILRNSVDETTMLLDATKESLVHITRDFSIPGEAIIEVAFFCFRLPSHQQSDIPPNLQEKYNMICDAVRVTLTAYGLNASEILPTFQKLMKEKLPKLS